ncbi:MAG: quinone oxidoreductase [Gammaproteobacteria bacterium]|nr:quinone oxidoreductase [Gammaproteobacteria bacterium]
MAYVMRIHKTGGAEVLSWEAASVGKPGRGEVRLKHTAVGLNFIDIYHRTGLYPVPLPTVLGLEAAAVVLEAGPEVTELGPGDRVAYASAPMGAYSEERLMPADRLVKLPASISDQEAAVLMLKGMTAQFLLRRTYPVRTGDTILIHAAAGGVGLIVCQWASALGATVIGTVGSEEKAIVARAHGCTHPILYRREDFVQRVRDITAGRGVDVVYDSVGRDTFMKSLDCLRPLGMMVSFGQSSGSIPLFDLGLLSAKGSLFLTRPSLVSYTARREDLLASAKELFGMVEAGKVKVAIGQTYPLREAARAHRDLEARRTTSATVMTV